jgi:protein involved in polysaccharide export with SLBB domain
METAMFRSAVWQVIAPVVGLLSLVMSGCASGPGNTFSLFSEGHKLTDDAMAIRTANAPPVAIPRELEKFPLPPYTVEPGDVLLVQPVDLDSPVRIPGDQPVLPDGTINLGKYGLLQVSGRTVPEIEGMVRAAVQAQVKDAGFINVRLVARQSKVYYVVGEVNSPGAFPLQGRETVLDGIMQAGGLNANGSRDNIILSRPTRPNCPRIVLPVCWKQIVQLGDTSTNYQLAPGDRIYVPSRTCLEWIPLLNRHAPKNPCCGPQGPRPFPPYPGGPCTDGPNPFRGVTGLAEGVNPHDAAPLPSPAPNAVPAPVWTKPQPQQ